jgi:SSS family solute:Na+ symporter
VGGWGNLTKDLAQVAQHPASLGLPGTASTSYPPEAWTSAWKPLLGGASANPMGGDLCCRSVTGARISWWCNERWPPET